MKHKEAYEQRLGALDENERRALRYGDWDIFAGQVFREFRRDVHVVDPFPIPEDWRKFRALDYGYANPACCLWLAIDYDGNIYVYRELYITLLTAKELARRIIELSGEEKILYTVADPSLWAKMGHEGVSIEETMRKEGLRLVQADNDRLAGKQQVHSYLRECRLKIFSTCVNLIRTLPQLVHDPKRPEDVDTDGEDHAYDALRYALMSRIAPPVTEERKKEITKRRRRLVRPVVSEITGY